MMEFIRYSADPCLSVPSADQYRRMTDQGSKPDGLWFGAVEENEGWEDFVRMKVSAGDAAFSLDQIKYRTYVKINTTKWLFVRNAEEFDRFTADYSQISNETLVRTRNVFRRAPRIDWPRFAQEFDAIVIAPFRVDRLQDSKSEWYRCWDVASGCVWNPEAVELSPQLAADSRSEVL